MFWFKKSRVVLDCFSEYGFVTNLAPIQKAVKFFPEWWKSLPKAIPAISGHMVEDSTIKTCPGFVELYRNSIIMPLWTDCAIDIAPQGNDGYRWQFADGITSASSHPHEQRGDYLPNDKYQHIKIASPWFLKTKEDIKWLYTQATYNIKNPDQQLVIPGVLNFKYQGQTNINMVFPRLDGKVIRHVIKRGQPLAQMIPMTEKEVDVRIHLVDSVEYKKLNSTGHRATFFNSYNKMVKILKAKEKSCPFH